MATPGVLPATGAEDVTPSGADVTPRATTDSIYVGGAGDVKVTMAAGDVIAYTCAAGTRLPIRATKIFNTGTDATNIIAWYN